MATTSEDEEYGFSDLPGWLQGSILAVVGIYVTWVYLPTWKFTVVWGSVGLLAIAVVYLFVQKQDEPISALSGLLESFTSSDGRSSQAVEKVDRLSSYQKSKLKNAVGMECEVTGCRMKRSLHVHHITPRGEGGGNELSNLIVVCRNHHADCDNSAFNRTQQREMIRGDRYVDEGIKDYWRGSVM